MNERMAPGHMYQSRLGTGIQWQPGVVKLWEGGQVTAKAPHSTQSPYEFWYNLAFKDSFPEVTHWWFRSAWTQKVRLTSLQGQLADGAFWGLMQFIDEQSPAQMYTITETKLPIISVPYPPKEVQPINLPLRLALSCLIVGIAKEVFIPNQWYIITSLVHKCHLEKAFPTRQDAIPCHIDGIGNPLRESLCRLQGIKQ
ncbi:MAG: hypothetical protein JW757_03935 [Anaerolineales bacterium]|nr:hypothetical protein [Anaerolineales bacterium]